MLGLIEGFGDKQLSQILQRFC